MVLALLLRVLGVAKVMLALEMHKMARTAWVVVVELLEPLAR